MLTRRDFLKSAAMAAVGTILPSIGQEPDMLLGYPVEYVDDSPLDASEIVLADPYQALCDAIRELLPEADKIAWIYDWGTDGKLVRAAFYSVELKERCVTVFQLSEKLVECVEMGVLAPFIADGMRVAFQDAECVRLARGDYVI